MFKLLYSTYTPVHSCKNNRISRVFKRNLRSPSARVHTAGGNLQNYSLVIISNSCLTQTRMFCKSSSCAPFMYNISCENKMDQMMEKLMNIACDEREFVFALNTASKFQLRSVHVAVKQKKYHSSNLNINLKSYIS